MVTGLTEDSFGSLTQEQIGKFEDLFHQPEVFMRMGRSIMAIPLPEEQLAARENAKAKASEEIGAKPKHRKNATITDKSEKQEVDMVRPLAYITSDWSDDEFEAQSMARKFCRNVYEAGFSPICPKLMYTDLFRDEVPQEHKDRLEMAAELLRRSRILIVCGDFMDEQVKDDVALAKRLRIPATTLDGIMEVEGSTVKRL